ncbi:hypothetical protein SESBI_31510 [Sesbania bispinosa]|nr:hypothetical protein SESBI_31510 [Sesbania bispinosa]
MLQNINQTLQQRVNSSGDSGNGIEGNLGGQNGTRSGAAEERWRKLEIPLFSGDNVYEWVCRVEREVFQFEGRLGARKVASGDGRNGGKGPFLVSLVEALHFEPIMGGIQGSRKVMEVQEADVADKIEGERKWDAVKENNFLGLMGQTQLIQVVYLRTKVHLEIHDELFHKFQIVAGSVLQAIRFLCKTFKQKLEAGLREVFKGSWLQEGLRGFSFDPGGTWLSAATSYSP